MTNKTYNPLLIISVNATSDLEKHRFIGFNGEHCAKDEKAIGVSDESVDAKQIAPVAVFGVLLVQAGGNISAGDAIASDENGKAVKAEDDAFINGYALDSANADEEVLIIRGI